MANEPLIARKPRVFYRPAASAGAGPWTEISQFFSKFELSPKVASIATPSFTTVGGKTEKGDPDHDLAIDMYHSRTWSEFSALMATEFNSEDDTEFMFKARGGVPTSIGNPYHRCKIKLTNFGKIGGMKNDISRIAESFKLEGQIEQSVTAGDPPADGTFSVFV